MAGLPEITIAGTVTGDPELRFTSTGTAVANFTVAANDRRLNRETGQWEDAGATFLRCTVWKQFAENVAESLRKGQRVVVTGTLRQRSWETNEGEKRIAFDVDVTEVGPSLRWATATVAKATRTTASEALSDDPWTSATPSADKPPF